MPEHGSQAVQRLRDSRPDLVGWRCSSAGVVWALRTSSLPPADFTFSNLGEIKTVDPALVTGASEGRVVDALFEGLTTWDPGESRDRDRGWRIMGDF